MRCWQFHAVVLERATVRLTPLTPELFVGKSDVIRARIVKTRNRRWHAAPKVDFTVPLSVLACVFANAGTLHQALFNGHPFDGE